MHEQPGRVAGRPLSIYGDLGTGVWVDPGQEGRRDSWLNMKLGNIANIGASLLGQLLGLIISRKVVQFPGENQCVSERDSLVLLLFFCFKVKFCICVPTEVGHNLPPLS
ncbi:hypothetical protein CRENBAI_007724 [Crenichthys baileyi]|uniref:Uncharacterized protein n=1 Tax=Crenichthys baileyi TaxID=28760 RepID=A0AAV9S7H4_9TELE